MQDPRVGSFPINHQPLSSCSGLIPPSLCIPQLGPSDRLTWEALWQVGDPWAHPVMFSVCLGQKHMETHNGKYLLVNELVPMAAPSGRSRQKTHCSRVGEEAGCGLSCHGDT